MTESIILAIVAVGLLVGGTVSLRRNSWLRRHGAATDGVVFTLENERGFYYPVVRYSTGGGEWVTRRLSVGTNPPLYLKGERVRLLFDPEDPQTVELDSEVGLTLAPIACIVSGMGFLAYIILSIFDMA